MSSESVYLYNSKIGDDYESDSKLDKYDLNNSFIDDSQLTILNVVLMLIQIILMKQKQNILQILTDFSENI